MRIEGVGARVSVGAVPYWYCIGCGIGITPGQGCAAGASLPRRVLSAGMPGHAVAHHAQAMSTAATHAKSMGNANHHPNAARLRRHIARANASVDKDFDGLSDLQAMIAAAVQGAPSRSQALPHLHAIATSRVCIDLRSPRQNEWRYRGKNGKWTSNGVWLSHVPFRAHATATWKQHNGQTDSGAGDEPCGMLSRLAIVVPNTPFTPQQRSDAARLLGREAKSLPDAQMRERLLEMRSLLPSPQFTVHRRLRARAGSVIAFGELQGNLDVNRWHCPERFNQPGLEHWSCGARPPYLGGFEPSGAEAEWSEQVPASPPFKYCRALGVRSTVQPWQQVADVALLLPEQHANVNVGHQAKDLVFAAHVFAMQRAYRGTRAEFRISSILVEDKSCVPARPLLPTCPRGFATSLCLPAVHSYPTPSSHARAQRARVVVPVAAPPLECPPLRLGLPHLHRLAAPPPPPRCRCATNSMLQQQAFRYRNASLHALVAGVDPPVHIAYLNQGANGCQASGTCATHGPHGDFGNEPPWRAGPPTVCFDVLLQKGLAYSGDWRGATLYRENVYQMCAIDPHAEADTLMLVDHGQAANQLNTRRWHNTTQAWLLASLRRRRRASCAAPPCTPLKLVVRDMKGLTFCEQAALYARARLVVVHHGAALANGLFLRPSSVLIELNSQCAATAALV